MKDYIEIDYRPQPIWFATDEKKPKCKISDSLFVDLLKRNGFGVMDDNFVHRQESGVITPTNEGEMTKWVYKYFKNMDYEDFLNPEFLGVVKSTIEVTHEDSEGERMVETNNQYFTKDEVIRALMESGWFPTKLKIYLHEFHEDKRFIVDDESKQNFTPLFRDEKETVYSFFRNGVVETNKNGSKLKDYDVNTLDGFIWEKTINNNIDSISINYTKKGLFEQFVEKCMSYQNEKGEWILDTKEYESFRTSYGYLLSNYTNGGDTPCVIFVDRDSDGKHAEGGNGKSLVMGSLKYWKPTESLNGRSKMVREGNDFVFGHVTPETEFVFIDDVSSDFDFSQIYNACTGEVHIQRKHKSPIVIPSHRKPKFGIATNYILSDNDFSTSRRQIINEFGSFWHDLRKFDEQTPDEFLGKRLFDEFTSEDWNEFFNYGFRCIGEYLQKGVIKNTHSNYLRKQIISQIEGDGVNDGVVDWIENYVRTNSTLQQDGIPFMSMYTDFDKDFDESIVDKWESGRFHKALFKICEWNNWNYNPDRKGKTHSQKRWLKGPKGNQVSWIKIVTQ